MALLKPIPTDYGVYASYWKIIDFSFNLDGSCEFTVSGYLNEDTRRANQLALKLLNFSVDAQTAQAYFPEGLDMHQVYQYLKTTVQFTNAEDA
jgi:hypothetical protein